MRALRFTILCVLFPSIGAAQTSTPPEQTLQAILNELRSIHAEVRAESARSQSMELLLAQLQVESETVSRAMQRVDAARSRTIGLQEGVQRATTDLTRAEDAQSAAETEVDKARAAGELNRLKDGLASMKRLEQSELSNQQEAEASLRRAQETYDSVEDQLATLMKAIRSAQSPENR